MVTGVGSGPDRESIALTCVAIPIHPRAPSVCGSLYLQACSRAGCSNPDVAALRLQCQMLPRSQRGVMPSHRRDTVEFAHDNRVGWTGGDNTAAPCRSTAGRCSFDVEYRTYVSRTARTCCAYPDVATDRSESAPHRSRFRHGRGDAAGAWPPLLRRQRLLAACQSLYRPKGATQA